MTICEHKFWLIGTTRYLFPETRESDFTLNHSSVLIKLLQCQGTNADDEHYQLKTSV